jgi:hypothetical protein
VLEPIIEEKFSELELDSLIERYSELIDFDVCEIIGDEVFIFPRVNVETPRNALLDTRRSYLEQIAKYKEFDMRTKQKKGDEK